MHLKRMHLQRMMEEYDPSNRETSYKIENIHEDDLKAASNDMAQKLYYHVRNQPSKVSCTFCNKVFKGAQAWEGWLEHIAYHFEKQRKLDGCISPPSEWHHDSDFEAYLMNENIVSIDDLGEWKITPIRATT